MRRIFFGDPGDTTWNLQRLRGVTRNFTHHELDIRDRIGIETHPIPPFRSHRSLPRRAAFSRQGARYPPFSILKQSHRTYRSTCSKPRAFTSVEAVFILRSTNKVYGDAPKWNFLSYGALEDPLGICPAGHHDYINENYRSTVLSIRSLVLPRPRPTRWLREYVATLG